MSEVRFKVSFASARRAAPCNGPVPGHEAPAQEESPARAGNAKPHQAVSRVARLLALAHYVERQVEAGAFRDSPGAAGGAGVGGGRGGAGVEPRFPAGEETGGNLAG